MDSLNPYIKMQDAPYGIQSCPVAMMCSRDILPFSASDGINVDWSEIHFCSVSQMAAIASIQLAGKEAGIRQRYVMPETEACSYMMRMDYCKILGIEREESFIRHDEANRFVPLHTIPINEMEARPGEIADKLEQIITANMGFSKSVSDILNLAFVEIIDNVIQHSRAASPGVACAQHYKRKGFVGICVADCGIGIQTSMAENPLYTGLSDAALIQKALEPNAGQWVGRGKMGTPQVSGGVGLSYPAKLVNKLGGHLWIFSHGSAVHVSKKGTRIICNSYYPGTLIVLRIPEGDAVVLESDIWDNGRDIPVYWNPIDGRYYDDDDDEEILW